MTTVWDLSANQCRIQRHGIVDYVRLIRLRPSTSRRSGGIIDSFTFELDTRNVLSVLHRRRYTTTLAFNESSVGSILNGNVDAGDHKQATQLMLSDVNMTVRKRKKYGLTFVTTDSILPTTLRPYVRKAKTYSRGTTFPKGVFASVSIVDYKAEFVSNTAFRRLDMPEKKRILSQMLLDLSKDGWYLYCKGKRLQIPSTTDTLTNLAQRKLHSHGTREQQDEWHDLRHAGSRSDSESGSSSGSESDSSTRSRSLSHTSSGMSSGSEYGSGSGSESE